MADEVNQLTDADRRVDSCKLAKSSTSVGLGMAAMLASMGLCAEGAENAAPGNALSRAWH
jgi:hypothetical protein